jgi:glycerol uptake facilitator-like aquaporin
MKPSLNVRLVAEFGGTAFLVAAVVGSGIMAERLAGGNVAVALLANTIATGAVLVALILSLPSISGAHLNPAVSLCDAWQGGLPRSEARIHNGPDGWGNFRGDAGPCNVRAQPAQHLASCARGNRTVA